MSNRSASRRRSSPRNEGSRWLRLSALCAVGVLLIPPLVAQPQPVRRASAVIPIHGEIDDIQRDSIDRRMQEARAAGATTLIFDINTPGGLVTSALDICRLIKNAGDGVRTVAWVNPQAYSAGAMISVACNEIWMSPSSSVGDCAPIMIAPTGDLMEVEGANRAKIESPILQEFRDSATRNGYDPLLSRAMVVAGEEVWWIEKISDPNERRFVNPDDKKSLVDEPDDESREWRLVTEATVPQIGKTLKIIQPVERSDELLTMSQYDAVLYGFAKGIVVDQNDLVLKLELPGPPLTLERSSWERLAVWLNSALVRGLLLILVFVGAYLEFQHPGMVVPGAIAVIALAIFLAAPYAAGLANIWPIVVLVLGLILLAVELFVIPGFGIAGLIGAALILLSFIGTFVPAEPDAPVFSLPTLPATWDGLWTGVRVLIAALFFSLAGVFMLMYYLPRSKVAVGVVSDNPDAALLAMPDAHPDAAGVGDIGVVTGDLRPSGNARFGQDVIEVQTQGDYVEAGRRVQVIRRFGGQVVVRALPADPKA